MPTPDPKPPKQSSRKAPAADPAGDAERTPTVAPATTAKRAKPATESAPTAKRAKTPAAKSAATTTEAPAPVRRRATRKRAATAAISDQERRHLIEVAAYYIAERGGFANGSPHDHWVEAEREIDAMIAAGFQD